MIDILRKHIIDQLGSNTENLGTVLNYFKPLHIARNEYIVQQGQVCRHVYFIAAGCLQVFVYDSNMNETTRDIVTEGSWCSELVSFGSGNPAAENIKSVEPCQLLSIDKPGFQKMILPGRQKDLDRRVC